MLKILKDKLPLIAMLGVSALSLGILAAFLEGAGVVNLPRRFPPSKQSANPSEANLDLSSNINSAVSQLTPLPIEQRAEELNQITQGPPSAERNQARYLLATDLINQGKGDSALPVLAELEKGISHSGCLCLTQAGTGASGCRTSDRGKIHLAQPDSDLWRERRRHRGAVRIRSA